MRVVVSGGTGFIGAPLCRALMGAGHEVAVLTRDAAGVRRTLGEAVEAVEWRAGSSIDARPAIDGADAVVNLAGASIAGGRWTRSRKQAIYKSRIETTRAIVEAIGRCQRRPTALLSASGIDYYDPREAPVDESTPPGSGFLAVLCRDWEAEARAAEQHGVRVALVRTGVALGRGGGALPPLLLPFKLFAGGPIGSGRQGFSWIHLHDVVGIYRWAMDTQAVAGPLNAVAPQALTNREFCQIVGEVLGRPCWLPVPALAIRLALGEMGEELLLQGHTVVPARTEELGYGFRFRDAKTALRDVLDRR